MISRASAACMARSIPRRGGQFRRRPLAVGSKKGSYYNGRGLSHHGVSRGEAHERHNALSYGKRGKTGEFSPQGEIGHDYESTHVDIGESAPGPARPVGRRSWRVGWVAAGRLLARWGAGYWRSSLGSTGGGT